MATRPAFTITAAGLTVPAYSDLLAYLTQSYQSIYGSDADLDPDTQDGQWVAIQAQAIYDAYQAAVAVYNNFSPVYAQGAGLDSMVQINGLTRLPQTNSTAVITVTGGAGTVITNGVVGDNVNLGTRWDLPASVVIPPGGSINVSATCESPGAVAAGVGSLTVILTPTLGWLTANNASIAQPGQPGENDATLRQRQAVSTSLPALSTEEAIYAAIAAVPGVNRLQVYVNSTNATDANGIPAHSIGCVVEGGNANAIAQAIFDKKSPGTGTFGSTAINITDNHGQVNPINFNVLSEITVLVNITIKALTGFVSTTNTLIQSTVALFLSELGPGQTSYLNKLYAPANLQGSAAIQATGLSRPQLDALAATYNVTIDLLKQAVSPSTPIVQDITFAFNQAATCTAGNVTITVT